jgi:hypothetical protein
MPAVPFDLRNPGPAADAFAITPSDTVNYTQGMARGIYVGGAGNIALVTPQGNVVTLTGVAVGSILQICSIRVNTATTATLLVGLL